MVSIPRIPRPYKRSSVVSMISVPKGKRDQNVVQNEGARSILPPRAVLSSPENDRIMGKRNRMETEQPSPPKTKKLVQSRHALCKIVRSPTPSKVVARSPGKTGRKAKKEETADCNTGSVTTRKRSKEGSDSKSDAPVKRTTSSCSLSKLNRGTR